MKGLIRLTAVAAFATIAMGAPSAFAAKWSCTYGAENNKLYTATNAVMTKATTAARKACEASKKPCAYPMSLEPRGGVDRPMLRTIRDYASRPQA